MYPIPEQEISKYFGDSNAGAAYLLYYQAADIDRAALGLHMPSPVGEPKDVLATNHTSSRSTSPVQDIQLILPPGLSDTSTNFVARTKIEDTPLTPSLQSEEKQPLNDNNAAASSSTNVESDSNPSSTNLNGAISRKPSIGKILGIRRPKSFSKPKTPNHHDSKRDADVQGQMPPFGSHLDASKQQPSPPRSPKRPATSAGPFARPSEKDKDREKDKTHEDTDSRPSNWFRRRSLKGKIGRAHV